MQFDIKRILPMSLIIALLLLIGAAAWHNPADRSVQTFEGDGVSLPIIMYHSLLKDSHAWNEYVISPDEFEHDLAWLRDSGYTAVTVQDLIDYVNGEGSLPDKPVMLTFDDGYYSVYLYALPLLKEYKMKAVLSIIGRYTDLYSLNGEENPAYSHVTWSQVAEMSDSGIIEIQNHTYNMHSLNGQRQGSRRVSGESYEHYEQVMMADLIRLQSLVDAYTRRMPTAFAYPYGFISKESGGILKDIGFHCSFTSYTGISRITRDPGSLFMLKRLLRPHGKSVEALLVGKR